MPKGPKIFALVNPKGGTGKSSVALLLAHSKAFRLAFKRVALVETDAQGSLEAWHEDRGDRGHVEFHQVLFKRGATDVFHAVAQGVGAVIVDVPGESTGGAATKSALAAADLAVVPMRPSEFDINALAMNLWPALSAVDTPAVVLPTFTWPTARAETQAAYFRQFLPARLPILPAVLPHRALYQTFMEGGRTLEEYAAHQTTQRRRDQAQKALAEVEHIAQEIIDHAAKN